MVAVVATGAAAFATGASVASAGEPVRDTVRQVDRVVKKVAGQGQGLTGQVRQRTGRVLGQPQQQRAASGVRPRQATPGGPGGYQPPLHGTNPHGQGTVGVVDLAPTGQRPLSGNPAGGQPQGQNNEEAVAGRARGEKDAQGYHGHITVLALFGNEVVGVDTRPGQTATGPLNAVQQGLLNPICTGSGICLEVLAADSATTSNSSTNRFAVANARVGTGQSPALDATAGQSTGNISEDANCQRSSGSSETANVSAGATPVARVANSSSSSTACRDGSGGVQQDSEVLNVLGSNLLGPGCGTGAPDTNTGLPPLLPIVCGADDTNGVGEPVMQAAQRYGVREALSVFVLNVGDMSLTKLTAAASESRAEAPAGPDGPPIDGPPIDDGDEEDEDDRGGRRGRGANLGGGGPAGPGGDAGAAGRGAGAGDAGRKQLAFTGLNAFALLALGLLAVPAGLRLRKATRSGTS